MQRFVPVFILMLAACTPTLHTPKPTSGMPKLTEGHFVTSDGVNLPIRRWFPKSEPKAIIVALHGFNDHGQFFNDTGEFLAQHGIASFAYDQRGFGATPNPGTWSGVPAYAQDASDALRVVNRQHPGVPLYLLGTSMGGAVAIVALTSSDAPEIKGVILAAPAVWEKASIPWYQRAALWLGAHTMPWFTVSGRGLGIVPSNNVDMLMRLGEDPLVIKETKLGTLYGLVNLMDAALTVSKDLQTPALILYGGKDQIIPKAAIRRMLSVLPQSGRRVAVYEGSYHMLLRDLQAAIVWKDIAVWIQNQTDVLPSKADQCSLMVLEATGVKP